MFKFNRKKPPGPSFLDLMFTPPSRSAVKFQAKMAMEYGPICKVPGILGFYLLSHPDYIEWILKTHHKNYLKTDLAYRGIRSVLGNGLLCNPDPDDWLLQRRHLQTLFQPQIINEYTDVITTATLELCQRWEMYADKGQAFNLLAEMLGLTFNIASKILFSDDFAPYSQQLLRFSELGNGYISNMLYLWPWLPTPLSRRFQRSQKEVQQIITDIIQQRQSNAPSDLLTTLLNIKNEATGQGLSEQRIHDEVKTFLVTGYETTGTALTWAWYQLTQHPEYAQQLQTNGLPYAGMIFEETLRLYPPIWMITRRAVAKDEIDGYTIPARATIITSPYLMQRHPEYWEKPETFNPLRFSEENKKNRPKFIYFPFGAGPRACIGSIYSTLEAQIILTTINQHFKIELARKKIPKPEYLITLRPKKGLWVKIYKK